LSALDEHFAHAWQTTMAARPEREESPFRPRPVDRRGPAPRGTVEGVRDGGLVAVLAQRHAERRRRARHVVQRLASVADCSAGSNGTETYAKRGSPNPRSCWRCRKLVGTVKEVQGEHPELLLVAAVAGDFAALRRRSQRC
jgi:hypothetical protein